jgi:hypothetical protein
MILGLNEEDIKNTTKELITRALSMELMINEGKTKYMVIMRGNQLHQNRNLGIENYCFEKVKNFKYLGVDINSRNNYHEEINLRIKVGNKCYVALQKNLQFQDIIKNIKNAFIKGFS